VGVVPELGLEAVSRGLEAVAVHEPVQAAKAPGLKALPPVTAQAPHEELERHLAGEEPREPVGVGVEANLDRDQRQPGIAGEQLGEHVGAAAAGAADEGDRRDGLGARDRLAAHDWRPRLGGGATVRHQLPVPRRSSLKWST
jgi:hypothetical protein